MKVQILCFYGVSFLTNKKISSWGSEIRDTNSDVSYLPNPVTNES